jgi:hypothetical protein
VALWPRNAEADSDMRTQRPIEHPFLQHLVERDVLRTEAAAQVQTLIEERQETPFAVALRAGMVDEQTLYRELATYTGYPLVSAASLAQRVSQTQGHEIVQRASVPWCRAKECALWATDTGSVAVAVADFPFNH